MTGMVSISIIVFKNFIARDILVMFIIIRFMGIILVK